MTRLRRDARLVRPPDHRDAPLTSHLFYSYAHPELKSCHASDVVDVPAP